MQLYLILLLLPATALATCSRPRIPQRMLYTFLDFADTEDPDQKFPVGTKIAFSCHPNYNDFKVPQQITVCQEDGQWDPVVQNFCGNELRATFPMTESGSGKSYNLPMKNCLTNETGGIIIAVDPRLEYTHFAAIFDVNSNFYMFSSASTEKAAPRDFTNDFLIKKREEKLFSLESHSSHTHMIAIHEPKEVCSVRIGYLDPDNIAHCKIETSGIPEGAWPLKSTEYFNNRTLNEVEYHCQIGYRVDTGETTFKATCNGMGKWTYSGNCIRLL